MILSYLRTLLLYCVLIGVVRLMGKRQIGQMEAAEFVVTMLVANLASIPMQDGAIPLYSGLVPILTVLGAELVLSWWTLRSPILRKIMCGKPVILVENGRILQSELRKTRVTLDELTAQLRTQNVLDFRCVQYAILETNGTLSVFPYAEHQPASAKDAGIGVQRESLPVTLVCDGWVSRENLAKLGRDESWLLEQLGQRNARVEDTFLFSADGTGQTIWVGKEHS